jgi:hypothetical protein
MAVTRDLVGVKDTAHFEKAPDSVSDLRRQRRKAR